MRFEPAASALQAAIVVLAFAVLFYYQINQADKAHAKLRKELDKSRALIEQKQQSQESPNSN